MKAIKNLVAAAFGVATIASKCNHSFERIPGELTARGFSCSQVK